MLLLIDNYDSFTYNLAQYLMELGQQVRVARNDEITLAEIAALGPAAIVLSPGPGTPDEAGVCLEVLAALKGGVLRAWPKNRREEAEMRAARAERTTVREHGQRSRSAPQQVFGHALEGVPVLGVCLGHQAIAQVFGGRVRRGRAVHGKVWPVYIGAAGRDDPLLRGLPDPFAATRYHSLVVEPASLPPCLKASAWTAEGEIMALRHRDLPIFGVQFHPESIGTTHGMQLLYNFVSLPLPGGQARG